MRVHSQVNPIIFLDIDGVLCTRMAAGWPRHGAPLVRSIVRRPVRSIDTKAVTKLNALCAEVNALIVVTSMWRVDRDVPAILKRAGLTSEFHKDWRTDANGPTRADEVGRWLAAHGAVDYVLIDDTPKGIEAMQSRVVLTDNYQGLTANDVDRALRILRPACESDALRLGA